MPDTNRHHDLYERIREAGYPVGGASYIQDGCILYRIGARDPRTSQEFIVTVDDEREALLALAERLGITL